MENQNNTNFQLNLRPRESYRVIIESKNEFSFSTFKMVYEKSNNEYLKIKNELKLFNTPASLTAKHTNIPNNIIAYTGNRGSGKTSALVSFLKSIETDKDCYQLPLMDPSAFEPSDSILTLVLACMYKVFEDLINEKSQARKTTKDSNAEQEDLEMKFQTSLRDLQSLYLRKGKSLGDPRDSENPYDTLSRLSSTFSITTNFKFLISSFLTFLNSHKNKKYKYLIIPIDDLDLNLQHSIELSEDIRKHLITPNAIVFVAIKTDQLTNALEEEYTKRLDSLFKNERSKSNKLSEEVENMSDHYVEKLFPASRNVRMPKINSREWLKENHIKLSIDGSEISGVTPDKNVETKLLEFISKKTRIIFLPKKERIHPIIPETIRELTNFLSFIQDLPDHRPNDSLLLFQDYFISKFPKYYLNHKNEIIIQEFFKVGFEFRLKFLLLKIEELFPTEFLHIKNESESDKNTYREFFALINSKNLATKIHLGDILFCLNTIESLELSDETMKKCFIIRTIINISIQRAVISENSSSLLEIIGTSIWNPKGSYLNQPKNGIFRTDYSELRKSKTPIDLRENYIKSKDQSAQILSALLTVGLDNRFQRNTNENSINSNLSNSGVKNITFDITLPFIWSYYQDIELNIDNESKRKNVLLSRFQNEYIGTIKQNALIFQIEIWNEILTKSLRTFAEIVKSETILRIRKDSTIFDEINLTYTSWSRILKNLKFNFEDNDLSELFLNIPFIKLITNEELTKSIASSIPVVSLFNEIKNNYIATNPIDKINEELLFEWYEKIEKLQLSKNSSLIRRTLAEFRNLFSNFFTISEKKLLMEFRSLRSDNLIDHLNICLNIIDNISTNLQSDDETE